MPTDKALDWMFTISKKEEAIGSIFHICNPKPFYVGDIFKQTFKAFNLKVPLFSVPALIAINYFRFLDIVGFFIRPFKPIAQRIHYFKWYLMEHMYYNMDNTKRILKVHNFEEEFIFPKDYIYNLASTIIDKLEVYKKK
jgi:hypothetical protein